MPNKVACPCPVSNCGKKVKEVVKCLMNIECTKIFLDVRTENNGRTFLDPCGSVRKSMSFGLNSIPREFQLAPSLRGTVEGARQFEEAMAVRKKEDAVDKEHYYTRNPNRIAVINNTRREIHLVGRDEERIRGAAFVKEMNSQGRFVDASDRSILDAIQAEAAALPKKFPDAGFYARYKNKEHLSLIHTNRINMFLKAVLDRDGHMLR